MKDKILRLSALGVLVTTSSCGIYNSQFECRPGKGLGCTSAWDVSEMIIESSNDEDPYDSTEHAFKADAGEKS